TGAQDRGQVGDAAAASGDRHAFVERHPFEDWLECSPNASRNLARRNHGRLVRRIDAVAGVQTGKVETNFRAEVGHANDGHLPNTSPVLVPKLRLRPPDHGEIFRTAAPRTCPFRSRSSASFAASRANGSTEVWIGARSAMRMNSAPSWRVR